MGYLKDMGKHFSKAVNQSSNDYIKSTSDRIIKDDDNVSRRLGPPLPPTAVINGTVVSEGTRGERPAEGSHLLKLPETALGGVDTTQSLELHAADATTAIDDMLYYGSQPYWIVGACSRARWSFTL